MTYDWTRVASSAARAILDKGAPATIVRRVRSGGPDYAPTYSESRTDTRVILDQWAAREREGTSIAATDLKVICPALGFDLTGADVVEMDGKPHEVVLAMPTMPGGVPLMWTLACRS